MNKYLIIFLVIMLILYIWAFYIEPNILVVKKYKISGLNKKIVFASDFHISKYDRGRLNRIINLINKQNPDLIISGGDFIKGHNGKTTLDIEYISKELKKLNAPLITVLGNHEGRYDKYKVKKALEKNGFKVLLNSNTEIDGLYIAGVDDLKTGFPDICKALQNTSSPKILVTHNPDIYYNITEKVDLILAGHVHGGQVRIPFKGALIVPSKYGTKFACGDFNETGNRMIVTKGLGTSLMTVRFNTFPEIIVLC